MLLWPVNVAAGLSAVLQSPSSWDGCISRVFHLGKLTLR